MQYTLLSQGTLPERERHSSNTEGPVTFMTKNGSLKFSDRVSKGIAHLNPSEKAGMTIISSRDFARYADAGQEGGEARDGDDLVLSSDSGSIRIEYADEPSEFKMVKEDFRGTGPIGGVVKYAIRKISGRPSDSVSRQNSCTSFAPVRW